MSTAPPAAPAPFPQPSATAFGFPAVLRRLRHRWPMVLCVSLLGFVAVAGVVLSLKPRYYPEATIMLEERQTRVVEFEQVLPRISGDGESVQGEVEVLRSRELLGRTVDALDLTRLPEFNRHLDPGGLVARLGLGLQAFARAIRGEAAPPEPGPDEIRAAAVTALQTRFHVEPIAARSRAIVSRVIRVGLTGKDAALTAEIVNTHLRFYTEAQLEAKLRAIRSARAFLATQAEEMRAKVEANERAVEEYRNKSGLLRLSGNLLVNQELADATSQLAAARTAREEADARLQQIGDPGQRSALPEVVSNYSIGRLREQEASLAREASQAKEILGSRHPRVVQFDAALADLGARIQREVEKVAESVRTQARVRRQQEAALQARVSELRARVEETNETGVELAALTREADVSRSLLQALLTREQEVSTGEALQQPDAKVLSRADAPPQPSSPRTLLFLAVGAVASLGLGVAAGLAPRLTGPGLQSADDVEPLLRARPLGLVPVLRGAAKSPERLQDRAESPAFTEAIRGVLTNLLLTGGLPKSVIVASALPGEGKTSVAVALARLAARAGYRTLLVDADLRRPSLHRVLGASPGPGLCDLLEERGRAEDAIQLDATTGLDFVACGERSTDPSRLFARDRFRLLMAAWHRAFDVVIVDSSPMAAVADGRVVARFCDEAVFVAQWDTTDRNLVQAEIANLRALGVSIAGVVLTKVDLAKHARHGYAVPVTYGGGASGDPGLGRADRPTGRLGVG